VLVLQIKDIYQVENQLYGVHKFIQELVPLKLQAQLLFQSTQVTFVAVQLLHTKALALPFNPHFHTIAILF